MSEHGKVLGAEFAAVADAAAAAHPEIPERCKTCAFRAGTVPNGHATTLADAMHCIIGTECGPFWCHQSLVDDKPTEVCRGYLLVKDAPVADFLTALERAGAKLNAMADKEST